MYICKVHGQCIYNTFLLTGEKNTREFFLIIMLVTLKFSIHTENMFNSYQN